MKSPICLYPDCNNTSRSRGLCHGHYQSARAMIRAGRITEESLASRGFMAPKGAGNGVINGSALFLDETARGDRIEKTLDPGAQPVPVAEFRNRITTLERMIRVDLAACVGAEERSRFWLGARRVAVVLMKTDCKRATAADWTRRERAIDRVRTHIQNHPYQSIFEPSL